MDTNQLDIGEMSSSHFWQLLLKDKPVFHLIDVRSPQEWEETGISDLSSINNNVILISWMLFTPSVHQNGDFLSDLEKHVPNKEDHLFFICKSGGRSLKAAEAAIRYGYKNVNNINDGFCGNIHDENFENKNINGWMNSNLPRKNYE